MNGITRNRISFVKSLIWYLNRLSKMPPLEIIHRFKAKLCQLIDKKRYWKKETAPNVRCLLNKRKEAPIRFTIPGGISERCSVKHKFSIIKTADQYCVNRLNIFNIFYNAGEKIDWHRDPKTRRKWPLKFWADIDIRDGFAIGGPKFVWEVNRLYSLNILGLAYGNTKDEKYARKFFTILENWMNENPYALGVSWTSGIELSIRTANLIWGLSNLKERGLSDEESKLVCQFVWFHGRHLYRYPSKYSSNNNHAIAEAFALFLIGVFFPEFKDANKWLAFGCRVLNLEAARQILPDGGSCEYTTTYLSFVFDFFLLYKLVCERNDIAFDPVIDRRLEQSFEFIHSLMDSAGNIANIGDQDSAILVDFGLDNHENFHSILNTGAVLFKRPELANSFFPDVKTILLLGSRAVSFKITRKPLKTEFKMLKHSGISVIRHHRSDEEVLFIGNATPLGMPPLYAHGHLDAGSFWLSFAGKEFFVDPGTYLYHSGGKWRRYFRSTAAHNTVRIDSKDFTEQTGDFMFGKPYQIRLHELQDNGDLIVWQVSHDAYERLKYPVKMIRRVEFNKQTCQFVFSDVMSTTGRHLCEIYFHFHPNCTSKIEQNIIWIERDNIKVVLEIDRRLSVKSYRGSEVPLAGWFSRRFNQICDTTTVVCSSQFSNDVTYYTKLIIQ